MKNEKVNGFYTLSCRLFGWSTLVLVACGVILYAIICTIDVPSTSPLVDPHFVIRELNDPTIPLDAELPAGTVTPINMLNNGQPIIDPVLVVGIALCIGLIVFGLRDLKDNWLAATFGVASGEVFLAKFVIQGFTDVFFTHSYLRAGAQSLIDDNHRLRVVIAYLQLWCERFDTKKAWVIPLSIFTGILAISYILAGIIEYRHWLSEKELTS